MNRRRFLKSSLHTSIILCNPVVFAEAVEQKTDAGDYTLRLDVPAKLFDGRNFWCHPRAGIVPGAGKNGLPRVVLTMTTMNIAGNDVYKNVVVRC